MSPTTSPTLRTVGPPVPDRAPLLAEGDRPAGRYRIVRLIARGGMGEVYEAEDEVLHERVALKTLRAHVATDVAAVERFKREIQLARRVTHPNVCRLFELGFHRPPGADTDTLFLTMELLEGESLADFLFREGPLTEERALPLVAQVAAGLAAAHAAGVVHRDLKSHNVMLVPGRAGLRAVVTDFGVARASDTETLAGEQPIVGSPAYMAPEQVAREPVGPAADVYSLGVLLFEMVTGHWPFEHPDPMVVARMRLDHAPPSPRVHAPVLDPRWEHAILKCLERDPVARFPRVEDVVADLVPDEIPVEALEPVPERPRRNRRRLVGAALVASLLAALAAVPLWRARGVPVAGPPVVVVLALRPAPGVEPWQALALGEALDAALAGSPAVRGIAGFDAQQLHTDLAVPAAESYSADVLARVRRATGATVVVSGLLAPDGGAGLRAALTLDDAAGGRRRAGLDVRGGAGVGGLATRVAEALAAELGQPPAPEAAGFVAAALPSRPEAAAAYVDGRARLARFDLPGARRSLESAVAIEPGFAGVHAALADLWTALRAPDRARASAERAHALAGAWPARERALLEARWHASSGRASDAARLLRELERGRTTLRGGLELARAEAAASRPVEARAALDAVRRLPAPDGTSPLVALTEAELALAFDFERARDAAARAAGEAEARGSRVWLAQALLVRAQASWMLSELADAVAGAEQARALHAALGDRARLADDLNVLLASRWQQGRLEPAAAFAREAAVLFEELGITQQAAVNLANLGFVLVRRGTLDAARASFEESAALSLQDDAWQGVPALGLAWVADLRGEPHAAEAYAAAARRLEGFAEPFPLAFLELRAAELAARTRPADDARRQLDDARRFAEDRGLRSLVAEARLAEADVLLGSGRAAEAEALAQAALAEATRMQALPLQALAHALRARARADQGDPAAAAEAQAAATAALRETDDTLALLQARLHLARAACRSGRPPDVDETAARAAAAGLRTLAADALALRGCRP